MTYNARFYWSEGGCEYFGNLCGSLTLYVVFISMDIEGGCVERAEGVCTGLVLKLFICRAVR